MSSSQKKKVSKSPKTSTDNSLLSAYVDSPQVSETSPSRLSPQNAGNRSGDNNTEKRNPHIVDDRQKPITKKNKNKKKREQQRKSLSENQDAEAGTANGSQQSHEDDVVESWEDIQDPGPSDTQIPPPPKFIIDEKAVEERKQKEMKEMEYLNNKMEGTKISNSADTPYVEKKDKTDSKTEEAKSKDDIKAEREAKKQAKRDARALAKENMRQNLESEKDNNSCDTAEHSKKSASSSNGNSTNVPVNQKSAGRSKKLKAERRAIQEAQRAAKENAASQKSRTSERILPPSSHATVKTKKPSSPKVREPENRHVDKASTSQNIPSRTAAQRKVKLFDHLYQYEREYSISKPFPVVNSHIHPAVLQLGLKYSVGSIKGSNARCLAFMHTVKLLITDYKLSKSSGHTSKDWQGKLRLFSENLSTVLDTHVTFLKHCRTPSVSMGNAIRLLKSKINSISVGTGMENIEKDNEIEEHAKQIIFDSIDTYIDQVRLAAVQISDTACSKIREDDVILTYGCSSLLREVFLLAAKRGRKFKVIVADGRPKFEGREMARHLVQAGIHTTYIFLQSVSYIISEVTKVFLGAHAVFANGCVMSRVGTSQVALLAKSQNVPILVCCETYKFSEKVQTDSFVFNELGDPDDLVATGTKTTALEEWRDLAKLSVLNLSYDVTPASFVDAIISEISVIPTTSVPVVLRLKSMDQSVS